MRESNDNFSVITKLLLQEKYQLCLPLLGGYTAYVGRYLPKFRYNLCFPSSAYDCLTLEDGNNRLFRSETTIGLRFITTQKKEDLIYIATKALNLRKA
jgi:hypothetical protein